MSSDNGIYLAEFPTSDGGKEYRVIEAQAIDNLDFGDDTFQDHARVTYFGNAKPFSTLEEAQKEANRLYDECMDGFGICEYGISSITFDRPLLSESVEEANKWIENWWKERENQHKPLQTAFDQAVQKVVNDPRYIAANENFKKALHEFNEVESQLQKEYGWQEAWDKLEEF